MGNDDFREEMIDKMNHGVSRLSPIALRLYFSLTEAFLSHGRKYTIKTSLLSFAKYLGVSENDQNDIISVIENAFREIHTNTFIKYGFEIKPSSRDDEAELYVSMIDNKDELKAIIERTSLDRKDLS